MVYERGGVVFVFNFSPNNAYVDYKIKVPKGNYRVTLSSDEKKFGGYDRISTEYVYEAKKCKGGYEFPIYLPARTAMCLTKVKQT